MRNYGFKMSKLTGKENEFTVFGNTPIPEKYSYKNYLPPVLNQGASPICVPCALSAHLNWNYNVDHDGQIFRDNKIAVNDIYKIRKNKLKNDGMSILEGLAFLKEKGVNSKSGFMKIKMFAKVTSLFSLKYALIMNGPCIGALRVYNENPNFWIREYQGQEMIGGHAIAIIGYNKEGFILRNSWGSSWGDKGYTIIPYDEFNKFLEVWTIVD